MIKKLLKAILFPHAAVRVIITPIAAVLLAFAFTRNISLLSYTAYVISAYALTVWCLVIPNIIAFFKNLKQNRYVMRFLEDSRLQLIISLYSAILFNIVYGVFQLGLGMYYASLWYYALAAYYILLTAVRLFLLKYTNVNKPGADMISELKKHRACGYVLLVLNVALSVIMFFIIARGRTFVHNQITTIAIAVFTFTALAVAIVNLIKYRKYNSPVFSACKIISLVAACVSMLTLESTMLRTFGSGNSAVMDKIFLIISGAAVSAFIVFMALYMIIKATKGLKQIKSTESKREGAEDL